MNFQKSVYSIMVIFAIIFSIQAEDPKNLLKNGSLNMGPADTEPRAWIGDKTPKQLVKTGILATLQQAIKIEIKEKNKQDGFIYQTIYSKNGFKQPFVVLQGYLCSSIKGGAFLQLKRFKAKKKLRTLNIFCTIPGKWELVKQTFPLEGADRIQVLCRYLRSEKYIGNIVKFADISLTTTDQSPTLDDFANKKIKIVVLGDSTVQTYAPGSILAGWGQFLQSYFNKGVGVHNFALSGRSSKTYIQEGLLQRALKEKADYAFIQFGHNDSHRNKPESTDAKSTFKNYLRQYAKKFTENGTKVIFVTPMCRMTFRKNGTLKDSLQPYANAMKEIAEEKKCLLIDLHEASKELFLKLGSEKCKELCTGRPKDRTHFSPKGADAMAKLIIQELLKSNSYLRKYIKK